MKSTATFLSLLGVLAATTAGRAQSTGVGIGTTTPQARLHVTDSLVLFSATGDVPASPSLPSLGDGRRMFWYPGKAAFRAGYAGSYGAAYWDNGNIGQYSFATGYNPRASGKYAFAAGTGTTASGEAAVALGNSGTASADRALAFNSTASGVGAIALGSGAQATSDDALALGPSSIAGGLASIVIGPSVANGNFATAIGLQNQANANFCTAIGKNARANNQGSMTLSDASASFSTDYITSTGNNQMNMRFSGGYWLYTTANANAASFTNAGTPAGVTLAAGGGSWTSLSDRRRKENFRPLDAEQLLQKVAALPVTEWNYRSQPATQRHIGPMAQDFYAAFGLDGVGADTTINTVDIDGVNMVAIQALEARTRALQKENEALKAQVAALQAQETGQAAAQTALLHRLEALEQQAATASAPATTVSVR